MLNNNTSNITESLLQVWKKILGNDDIKSQDDFFSIGGTSLDAIRIIHEINSHFNVEIDMETFLENPNVVALSEQVLQQRRVGLS